uniref:Uncharacterized protein n=1 Tax=Coccidioides posadasii RMSCC 3488 TaxID=454284 RepID=A0A0J6IF02_COCPO|nr:hypothetical protein CPAG_06669 [Coccidioides posadasii RMSCC 3488]
MQHPERWSPCSVTEANQTVKQTMVHRVKGRGIVVEGQTSLSPSRRLPRFPGDSWLDQTSPREKKSQVTRENPVPARVVIPGFPSQSGYMYIHASRFTTDGPTRVVADSSTSKS